MSVGTVLIHGYSGSPEDLNPLANALVADHDVKSVINVCLPGHGSDEMPAFDRSAFVQCIYEAMATYRNQGRKIVVVGHSTGGVLGLSFLSEYKFVPDLLVLAAVPKHIDTPYLERWNNHRSGQKEIPFSSIANMVTLINSAGALQFKEKFPVLIIHGKHDNLVLPDEAFAWEKNSFAGPKRLVFVPGANHNIFCGPNSAMAIDIVRRAVADINYKQGKKDAKIIEKIWAAEPESRVFVEASAFSGRHLAQSPSARRLIDNTPTLPTIVRNEPVFANIEITTRCNLSCQHCAHTFLAKAGNDMPLARFRYILDMLPHAYRITLVGLGEPLLHPDIVEFVAEASTRKRRIGLVTNAMGLDRRMSSELLKAGLHSVAFSIDAPNQDVAGAVRAGSDVNMIIENVNKFVELSRLKGEISTAVFTAVSIKTVSYLKPLIDVVRKLGVHVLMLTDLNFKENLNDTLWKNADAAIYVSLREAVAYAFSKKLPVLSVHALEEFGLWQRYRNFLLLPPDQLVQRSIKQTWCCSPWQTLPFDVRGNATICDCQPQEVAGNILHQPFSEIWNGEVMTEHRRRMLESNPPDACKICPRF